jgi:hypothetical protein
MLPNVLWKEVNQGEFEMIYNAFILEKDCFEREI